LKHTYISLLVLVAFGLTCWSFFNRDQGPNYVKPESSLPDAFMEKVTATIVNQEGHPSLKIESPKMVHYAENDRTDIQTPHIIVYRNSPEPWHIDSRYAKATDGIAKIIFWDQVIIHHLEDKAAPKTTIKTDSLTVFPAKQLASTQDSIEIIQPDTTIHAIGMFANLEVGTVKLLSATEGDYVPRS
jgi:lipopolysaccharide export system protein LptC